MINLRKITEDNFLDAFRLKLAKGQEDYVAHPIRSLAQAYVYRDQCQPFGIYDGDEMVGYVMVIYDYDIPEYDDRCFQTGRGLRKYCAKTSHGIHFLPTAYQSLPCKEIFRKSA